MLWLQTDRHPGQVGSIDELIGMPYLKLGVGIAIVLGLWFDFIQNSYT